VRSDFGRLRLVVPIRLAVPVVIPLAIGILTGQIGLGVAAALGAFLCGLADVGDCLPVRARVMGIAAIAITLITIIGSAVSQSVLLTIALSPLIAFVCGYATSFGQNAGLTGTLGLVMYSLFAGAPVSEDHVLAQATAVFAGCLLQTIFALAGWPLRRVSGMRSQLADTWRMFYVTGRGSPERFLSPALPAQLAHCAADIRYSGTKGETLRWLGLVLDAAQQLRLPLASIAGRRAALRESGSAPDGLHELDAFSEAVALFSRSVSRALVLEYRRHGVAQAMAHVEQAGLVARSQAPVQVDAVLAACRLAAYQFKKPFPLGHRGEVTFTINFGATDWRRAFGNDWHWSSPILRHSIRLALVTPVAWIVGELVLTEHHYWVALTVAWVARPGYGTTFGRVVSRTGGTLVGLALIGAVIVTIEPGVWGLVVICGISAYVLFATMPVNYAFAVIFVTTLIVTLLTMNGDSLTSSLDNRAIGTILGGILTLIASQIGASWAAPTLAQKLAAVTDGTQRYVNAVFYRGEDLRTAAGNLVNARRDAATAIEEAALEPPRGHLPPARAERVLSALLAGIFVVASVDPTSESTTAFSSQIDPERLDTELAELERQLLAIDAGTQEVSGGPMPQVPIVDPNFEDGVDPACQAVKRAIAYLQ